MKVVVVLWTAVQVAGTCSMAIVRTGTGSLTGWNALRIFCRKHRAGDRRLKAWTVAATPR
jgi:hypothetical protein